MITKIVVEEDVNGIGQMAFCELPNLNTVVLADSVDELYGYNFKNCTSLTDVAFNENVFVEEWAFAHTSITTP